jgi:hypothetical protein
MQRCSPQSTARCKHLFVKVTHHTQPHHSSDKRNLRKCVCAPLRQGAPAFSNKRLYPKLSKVNRADI